MSSDTVKSEVTIQFYQGCQVALSVVLNKSIHIITLFYIGHMGDHFLSSFALASVISTIFGKSILIAFGMINVLFSCVVCSSCP